MRGKAVLKSQMPADPGVGFREIGVGPRVDFLIFDAPPEPLDEVVVPLGALAIHADLDLAGG